VNGRWYQSKHYAKWLNRLSKKTPDSHPDKQPLLAAVSYLQDSVMRANSISHTDDSKIREKPAQEIFIQGDRFESLSNQSSKYHGSIEDDPDDTVVTEFLGKFRFDF
jgi:hypothetical protein